MAKKKNSELIKLKNDLKEGRLSSMYLFYGEETYLREMYTERVRELVPDGGFPEFNYIFLDGKDVPYSDYDNAWEGFPMMAEKRLIHIKDSGTFSSKKPLPGEKKTDEKKTFWAEKFKRINDDTVVIFEESDVDGRSALYKAAKKCSMVVNFEYLEEADLVTWVIRQCLKAKKKITKNNAALLVLRCDPGLSNLSNELNKLFEFCDKEITAADIERVVSKPMHIVVFDLSNAIIGGNTEKAVRALADMRDTGQSSFALLYLLLSSFERLLRVKAMSGASTAEIAGAIGVPPGVAQLYIRASAGVDTEKLIWMTRRVAELDLAIKEGRLSEWTALEQYVLECINIVGAGTGP